MSTTPTPGEGLFSGLSDRVQAAEAAQTKPTMNMAALIELPSEQRQIVRHLLRAETPPTLEQTAAALELPIGTVEAEVGKLTLIGLVERTGDRLHAVAGWRSSRLPPGGIWSSLGNL
jgi:predicted transcriptional regulator